MIKAIIFDFFGVLVTEGFKLFRDTYFPNDEAKWQAAIDLVNRHDSGQLSWDEFCKGMSEISGQSAEFVSKNLNNNLPNEPLLSYIRKDLKPNYKLGVLSNAGGNHLVRLLGKEDVELFDDIVLSYKYRMIKPQKEIFELAAKRLSIQMNECIFIDDSPGHCEGAQRAGMQAIHYQDFEQFRRDLEKMLSPVTDN